MKPNYIDHIVLLVNNLSRTEKFYSAFLGKPVEKTDEQIAYQVGDTKLFFGLPGNKNSQLYNKENLGLNHLAFGVRTAAELKRFGRQLSRAKIRHSGIRLDTYGKKEFIWFDDPDGIRVEFYLRQKAV